MGPAKPNGPTRIVAVAVSVAATKSRILRLSAIETPAALAISLPGGSISCTPPSNVGVHEPQSVLLDLHAR